MSKCPICSCEEGIEFLVPWSRVDNKFNFNKKFTYIKCKNCECAYLDELKNWTPERYSKYIYNSDYSLIDPGYNGYRAKKIFSFVYLILNYYKLNSVLDYGGGNGVLTDLLNVAGFKSVCYDEYNRKDIDNLLNLSFDACVTIEVLEHELNADDLWNKFKSFIKLNGFLICTTDYLDGKDISSWAYAHPRAGHTLLYSKKAIIQCALNHGFKYINDVNAFDGCFHIFQKVSN